MWTSHIITLRTNKIQNVTVVRFELFLSSLQPRLRAVTTHPDCIIFHHHHHIMSSSIDLDNMTESLKSLSHATKEQLISLRKMIDEKLHSTTTQIWLVKDREHESELLDYSTAFVTRTDAYEAARCLNSQWDSRMGNRQYRYSVHDSYMNLYQSVTEFLEQCDSEEEDSEAEQI